MVSSHTCFTYTELQYKFDKKKLLSIVIFSGSKAAADVDNRLKKIKLPFFFENSISDTLRAGAPNKVALFSYYFGHNSRHIKLFFFTKYCIYNVHINL